MRYVETNTRRLTFAAALMFLMCCYLPAQAGGKKTYTVYVNGRDYSSAFDVMSVDKKVKTDPGLTYYWYAFNKLHHSQGGYDGKLLDGNYTVTYLDNNLKEKGHFKKGLKNGEWISWDEKGHIKEVHHWKNGLLDGIQQQYNDSGKLVLQKQYRNNVLNGCVITYKNGKAVSCTDYQNGVKVTGTQGNCCNCGTNWFNNLFHRQCKAKTQNKNTSDAHKQGFFAKVKQLFAAKKGKNDQPAKGQSSAGDK